MPRFSTGSRPSCSRSPDQILGKTHEPRIRFGERRAVARLQVVIPAVEVETDAVVQQRSPVGSVDLLLGHTGQAIVGRPAVQEVPVLGQSFAERAQEPCGQSRFAQHGANGDQLVSAIAAVLLALAPHAVHDRFDRRIVERVDRRVEQSLQCRIRTADHHVMRPGKHAAAHAHVAHDDRADRLSRTCSCSQRSDS